MSNCRPCEDGKEEGSEFSFKKALEDVSQQGCSLIVSLQEKQQELSFLQAVLSESEKRAEAAELLLRSSMCQIFSLDAQMEHQWQQSQVLWSRLTSTHNHNIELRFRIEAEEEGAHIALVGYNTYRNKMEGHRLAVAYATSQTEAHKELQEKRALVEALRQKVEELRDDLENPNGKAMWEARREMDLQREEIAALRDTVAAKRERLRHELDTHTHLKEDIQIQHRHYEAIVKRLHCKLNKAQSIRRQVSGDIHRMEKLIMDLKRQLYSSEDHFGQSSKC